MIQFHSYHLGVHCYHCQFAEVGFFHGIAPVGLAAPANTSTMGNKKNSPNPTTIPSIASGKDHSFCQPALSFPSLELCRKGSPCSRREKTSKENLVFTVIIYLHGQVWTHMIIPIQPFVSAPKSSAPGLWKHSSEAGWLPVPAGLKTILSYFSGPSASPHQCGLPPQLGTADVALALYS